MTHICMSQNYEKLQLYIENWWFSVKTIDRSTPIFTGNHKLTMLTAIHPKLPMRDKQATKDFYLGELGFQEFGSADFDDYLMVEKGNVQIHFFLFRDLVPDQNYGQVYVRTNDIDALYQSMIDRNVGIHPAGHLSTKPWGQREFSLLDPDKNLLTFGQGV